MFNRRFRSFWWQLAKTVLTLALATGCSWLISRLGVGKESIIMVFIIGVLFSTVLTSSYLWGAVSAGASLMLFNFFFTEPIFTFVIYSSNDIMLLAFFMVTALISGTVTSRLQQQMELAGKNEAAARTMYEIASGFASASGEDAILDKAVSLIQEYTNRSCAVLLGEEPDPSDGASTVYPIRFAPRAKREGSAEGSLVISGGELDERGALVAEAVATQLSIALERERLYGERENIRIAMERELQRSTFLRSVAHDLRSPLTALSGAGNLLVDNYDMLTDPQRKKLAADISEETLWLASLVENILSMTRISDAQLVLHKEDEVVDDVISEAVSHTERLRKGRAFTVRLPEQVVMAPMDGKLIVQVLINLIENAVSHTSPDAEISLSVAAGEKQLILSVADTGEGVAEEVRDAIFDRFVTLDSRVVDGKRGLGLGLAICKAIVEAHGGAIRSYPNFPKGTVFEFTLPLDEEEQP